MAQSIIDNGENAIDVRNAINNNTTELYNDVASFNAQINKLTGIVNELTNKVNDLSAITDKFVEWQPATNYYRHEIVTYANKYYVCKVDHTSSVAFELQNFNMLVSS